MSRVFFLGLHEDIAIGQRDGCGRVVERHVHDVIDAQDIHCQTLKAVSELARNRAAIMAADLLEIGELRHFHAVTPNLPAQPPSAEGRGFPVVLDKADVMQRGVDADGFQRAKVEVLQIGRRGFDDHLILIIMLQAVGVFAIAAIGWAARGLHIGRSPRF